MATNLEYITRTTESRTTSPKVASCPQCDNLGVVYMMADDFRKWRYCDCAEGVATIAAENEAYAELEQDYQPAPVAFTKTITSSIHWVWGDISAVEVLDAKEPRHTPAPPDVPLLPEFTQTTQDGMAHFLRSRQSCPVGWAWQRIDGFEVCKPAQNLSLYSYARLDRYNGVVQEPPMLYARPAERQAAR